MEATDLFSWERGERDGWSRDGNYCYRFLRLGGFFFCFPCCRYWDCYFHPFLFSKGSALPLSEDSSGIIWDVPSVDTPWRLCYYKQIEYLLKKKERRCVREERGRGREHVCGRTQRVQSQEPEVPGQFHHTISSHNVGNMRCFGKLLCADVPLRWRAHTGSHTRIGCKNAARATTKSDNTATEALDSTAPNAVKWLVWHSMAVAVITVSTPSVDQMFWDSL